jgi:hypothetical protein
MGPIEREEANSEAQPLCGLWDNGPNLVRNESKISDFTLIFSINTEMRKKLE